MAWRVLEHAGQMWNVSLAAERAAEFIAVESGLLLSQQRSRASLGLGHISHLLIVQVRALRAGGPRFQ